MGGWEFIRPQLEKRLGRSVQYIGRDASATTATGFPGLYQKQQAALLNAAFE